MSIFDRPEKLKVNLCGVVRIPADPAVVCLRHGNAKARPDYVLTKRAVLRQGCAVYTSADSQALPNPLQNRFYFDHADVAAI